MLLGYIHSQNFIIRKLHCESTGWCTFWNITLYSPVFEYLLICFLLSTICSLCCCADFSVSIWLSWKLQIPNSSSMLLICCVLSAGCAICLSLCYSAVCSLFISFYTSYSPVACNMEIPSCAICIAVPILHFIICLCTGNTYWKLQHWNPPYIAAIS